jgi:hypothetical protein
VPVVITGLKELRRDLAAAYPEAKRAVSVALKVGADAVTARARELAPKGDHGNRKTPPMASTLKAFSNTRGAGVKTSHPGAGVQNYATTYSRRTPGGSGTSTVTLVNVSPFGANKDRFMYKAIEELGEGLVDDCFEEIVDVLRLTGWFGDA